MAAEKNDVHQEAVENIQETPNGTNNPASGNLKPATENLAQTEHINLTWRSWLVVFVSCFAIMAQVFVVVAAGSVIAFIIRDLGEPNIAGWIIRTCIMTKSIILC